MQPLGSQGSEASVNGETPAAEREEKSKEAKQKKPWSGKKKAIVIGLCAVLAVLVVAGVYALTIMLNPMGGFQSVAQQITPPVNVPKVQQTPTVDEPEPTVDPYDELLSKADFGLLDDIVNIMLIGVDYAEERETWKGKKDFHADVMIVLAINTKTNEVNLVSLPRDTYANIPGVTGIYKLNASIDCGGGWPAESGFEKVCESASWMLGGIPVHYYYAVDMGAVKALVDKIGGIEHNLDFAYTIQGRSYKTGLQHLDGQAVLDYLRVRKGIKASEAGDLNRINRQKEVLVALFNKIKNEGLIYMLPEMLDAFDGNLYTNVSFAQTAGLAAFLYNVDSSNIHMHSMDGSYHNIFNWRFVVTNQNKRIKLIKSIYGIDVKPYNELSSSVLIWKWEKMQAEAIYAKSREVLTKVKRILDEDALLPELTPPPDPAVPTPDPAVPTPDPAVPTPDPAVPTPDPAVPTPDPAATLEPISILETGFFETLGKPSANMTFINFRKYSQADWDLYYRADSLQSRLLTIDNTEELAQANLSLKADIEELCRRFSIAVPNWRVNYEREYNQIYVDFN